MWACINMTLFKKFRYEIMICKCGPSYGKLNQPPPTFGTGMWACINMTLFKKIWYEMMICKCGPSYGKMGSTPPPTFGTEMWSCINMILFKKFWYEMMICKCDPSYGKMGSAPPRLSELRCVRKKEAKYTLSIVNFDFSLQITVKKKILRHMKTIKVRFIR